MITRRHECDFGKKHRGKLFKDIVEEDPQYILWLEENTMRIVSDGLYYRALYLQGIGSFDHGVSYVDLY